MRRTRVQLPEDVFGRGRMLVDGAMEGVAFDVAAEYADAIMAVVRWCIAVIAEGLMRTGLQIVIANV